MKETNFLVGDTTSDLYLINDMMVDQVLTSAKNVLFRKAGSSGDFSHPFDTGFTVINIFENGASIPGAPDRFRDRLQLLRCVGQRVGYCQRHRTTALRPRSSDRQASSWASPS